MHRGPENPHAMSAAPQMRRQRQSVRAGSDDGDIHCVRCQIALQKIKIKRSSDDL
jgi:hypothetical protein